MSVTAAVVEAAGWKYDAGTGLLKVRCLSQHLPASLRYIELLIT